MTAMLIFSAMMVFLVCGGTLLLYQSFVNTEEQRARHKEEERAARASLETQMAAQAPRFFASLSPRTAPQAPMEMDEELRARIETYLIMEQDLAANFVDNPTVDNLYRRPTLNA